MRLPAVHYDPALLGKPGLARWVEATARPIHAPGDSSHALAAAEGTAFDVFLLDIGLPGMDGYTLARSLRQRRNGRTAMLIALTGYGAEHEKQRGDEAGFDHYMVKPAKLAELANLLQTR